MFLFLIVHFKIQVLFWIHNFLEIKIEYPGNMKAPAVQSGNCKAGTVGGRTRIRSGNTIPQGYPLHVGLRPVSGSSQDKIEWQWGWCLVDQTMNVCTVDWTN